MGSSIRGWKVVSIHEQVLIGVNDLEDVTAYISPE